MFLIKQMAEREGVAEQLKVESQLLWGQKMNKIKNKAEKVVKEEMIYLI